MYGLLLIVLLVNGIGLVRLNINQIQKAQLFAMQ